MTPRGATGPRLFVTNATLETIRSRRRTGLSGRIWRNLRASALDCVSRPVRGVGIEPIVDDPDYENLYERFYAIMSDAAELEHASWAAAVEPNALLLGSAERRLAAVPRAWAAEAGRTPDYGSAYSTTRLLRSVAIGLDLVGDRVAASVRKGAMAFADRLAGTLWEGWFSRPISAGRQAHTHHAHVEWGSFGVAALALLGVVPDAVGWIDAATQKFDRHLLPGGLAPDGAQVEGASFWASTMTQRLAFMDALHRVTGNDLFSPHRDAMSADVSIAAIAGRASASPAFANSSVVLEPGYAQLPYHAPALLGLARAYRRPLLRHLASWDATIGSLDEPEARTARGERLRFALGGHALAWDDPTLPAAPEAERLAYYFPSVNQAYLRDGWRPGGTVVGVDGGRTVVHHGGQPVLVDLVPERILDRAASEAAGTGVYGWSPPDLALTVHAVDDDGARAVIHASHPAGATLDVELVRPGTVHIRRQDDRARTWWSGPGAVRSGDTISFRGQTQTTLAVRRGRIVSFARDGYREDRGAGYGNLRMVVDSDPAFPLVGAEPDDAGRLEIEVTG